MKRLSVLLLLTGCASDPIDWTLQCPSNPDLLGQSGDFSVASTPVQWRWDRQERLSWAPAIYAQVPDDIVSLSITVDAGDAPAGIGLLAINDRTLIDVTAYEGPTAWDYPPFAHWPEVAGSVVLPVNADTWPEPGCLALLPVSTEKLRKDEGTVHIVTRHNPNTEDGHLDLNAIIVEGTALYQEELDAAVQVMADLYADGGGPAIDQVSVWDVAGPDDDIIAAEGADIQDLRRTTVGSSSQAMNLFFITDFAGGDGTLGIAAGIPGPVGVPGTAGSGVVISVDSHLDGTGELVDTQLLGETMAHEVGHQLGLFHTTEEEGTVFDVIADTPECPAGRDTNGDGVYPSECLDLDGANFMFWTAEQGIVQDEMSVVQSDVLYFSPAAH